MPVGTARTLHGVKPAMPSRRQALKTIAGATVVGSLSGCLQLATQRTTHFYGTPAMVSSWRGRDDVSLFSSAVSVGSHKTVKRLGITKEIVAHSWGMLYSTSNDFYVGNDGLSGTIAATFTTPSIQIAGQKLNPIKDLTVTDIGTEFLATVRNGTAWPGRNTQMLTSSTVQKATGRKVLRAFRDAVGGENQVVIDARETTDATYVEFDIDGDGDYEIETEWPTTTPDWNGSTYSASYKDDAAGYGSGADDPWSVMMRFDRHNGDYVAIFGLSPPAYDTEDTDDFIVNATYSSSPDVDGVAISHPTSDKFTREHLVRHLLKTNRRGIQTLVEGIATLVDETKDLLQKAADNSQEEETNQVISDILADVRSIEELNSGMQSDLNQISFQGTGATMPPEVERINTKAKEIQELATRAQERMANIRVDVDGDGTYDQAIEEKLGEISNRANTARAWTTDQSVGLSQSSN